MTKGRETLDGRRSEGRAAMKFNIVSFGLSKGHLGFFGMASESYDGEDPAGEIFRQQRIELAREQGREPYSESGKGKAGIFLNREIPYGRIWFPQDPEGDTYFVFRSSLICIRKKGDRYVALLVLGIGELIEHTVSGVWTMRKKDMQTYLDLAAPLCRASSLEEARAKAVARVEAL